MTPMEILRHVPFRLLNLLVILLAGAVVVGCGGSDEDDAADEATVFNLGDPITDSTYAVIVESDYGSDTLTTDEFQQQFNRFVQQFPPIAADVQQSRELRQMITESFVLRHVLKGEADRSGVEADTADVSAQLAQIRGQFPSDSAFTELMAAQGVTEEELRTSIEDQMRQERVQEDLVASAASPTADEMESYRQEQAEQVRAQHILFMVDPSATEAEEGEVETLAAAVLDSIQDGADFAEMARRYSEDGSASQGGDLNYFSRGDMVPPFEEAVYALQDSGDVTSEPVRTRFGYHLIRLTGRRTGDLPDTAQVRQVLMRERQQQAMEEGFERLREDANVVVRLNDNVVDAELGAS